MKTLLRWSLLGMTLWGAITAPADGTSPPEVVARLVANASKKPPGPVEDDLTEQQVKAAPGMLDALGQDGGPKQTAHELLASEFNTFAIESPMTTLYSDGSAVVLSGKVKMTATALADEKADEKDLPAGQEMSIGFGDVGGGAMFVGPKVRDDGRIMATFCLVMQKGAWKVHCAYLSDDPLTTSDLNFVVKQLTAFAKNPDHPFRSADNALASSRANRFATAASVSATDLDAVARKKR